MELENLKLKQQNELFMQMLSNQKKLSTPN